MRGETPTLLGPLQRAEFLEYRMIDKVRKPSKSERNTVVGRLIGILSVDVFILMTEKTLPLIWLCQQTDFSLLGRGKSTAAPSTASSRVHVWLSGVEGESSESWTPYLFEDEDGHAVTVTSARYVEMLRNFLIPELVSRCGTQLYTI
jgi:hypothetical protein